MSDFSSREHGRGSAGCEGGVRRGKRSISSSIRSTSISHAIQAWLTDWVDLGPSRTVVLLGGRRRSVAGRWTIVKRHSDGNQASRARCVSTLITHFHSRYYCCCSCWRWRWWRPRRETKRRSSSLSRHRRCSPGSRQRSPPLWSCIRITTLTSHRYPAVSTGALRLAVGLSILSREQNNWYSHSFDFENSLHQAFQP